MSKVIHFEIHAGDPERAMKFYTDLLGWKFQKWEGAPTDYWMIIAGEEGEQGVNGGLLKRMGEQEPKEMAAVNSFICTVRVDSVDSVLEKATNAGCPIALPKMAVPGMGWLAYIKDTEGNILGVMQEDKDAK